LDPPPEISEEVLEEGCYHLSKLGLEKDEIAGHFNISPRRVDLLVKSYRAKLKSGELAESEFDRVFWDDVRRESAGDFKVTFVSEKGFHHAWKSELERLDGPALMSIFEASKDFLSSDPNQRFLDYAVPKGFDPIALDREVKKAVDFVSSLLQKKWEETRGRPDSNVHT
jgi:hypothetical protein